MLETYMEALCSKRINNTKILINFPCSCPVGRNGPLFDRPIFPSLEASLVWDLHYMLKNLAGDI